jgi:hypothetical protein
VFLYPTQTFQDRQLNIKRVPNSASSASINAAHISEVEQTLAEKSSKLTAIDLASSGRASPVTSTSSATARVVMGLNFENASNYNIDIIDCNGFNSGASLSLSDNDENYVVQRTIDSKTKEFFPPEITGTLT